eukprot:g10194.t1
MSQLGAPGASVFRRRRLLASAVDECPAGKTPFVDAAGLHDIHYLIFYTAFTHIVYSVIVYFFGRLHTKRWVLWERLELKEDHHLLHKHKDVEIKSYKKGCVAEWAFVFFQQWAVRLDYTQFVSVRKFYVVKNKLKPRFRFYHFVDDELQKDFAQLAGISWWMWILLAIQVVVEGMMENPLSYGTSVALIASALIGCKMIVAANKVASEVLLKFDNDGKGTINPEELIDATKSDTPHGELADVEPHFWFDRPWVMGIFVKALMFQNAISVATGMFYVMYFGQKNNCYMKSRSWTDVIVSTSIGLLVMLHHGFVLLPYYAMVMHLGNHKELDDFLSRLHTRTFKRFSGAIKKHKKVHPECHTLASVREKYGAGSKEYRAALKRAAEEHKNAASESRSLAVVSSRTEKDP